MIEAANEIACPTRKSLKQGDDSRVMKRYMVDASTVDYSEWLESIKTKNYAPDVPQLPNTQDK